MSNIIAIYYVYTMVCLKIHSHGLYSTLYGIFIPNSVNTADMAALNWYKSPQNCGTYSAKSNFQTHPGMYLKSAFLIVYIIFFFCRILIY